MLHIAVCMRGSHLPLGGQHAHTLLRGYLRTPFTLQRGHSRASAPLRARAQHVASLAEAASARSSRALAAQLSHKAKRGWSCSSVSDAAVQSASPSATEVLFVSNHGGRAIWRINKAVTITQSQLQNELMLDCYTTCSP